jgi:hypothetical protein
MPVVQGPIKLRANPACRDFAGRISVFDNDQGAAVGALAAYVSGRDHFCPLLHQRCAECAQRRLEDVGRGAVSKPPLAGLRPLGACGSPRGRSALPAAREQPRFVRHAIAGIGKRSLALFAHKPLPVPGAADGGKPSGRHPQLCDSRFALAAQRPQSSRNMSSIGFTPVDPTILSSPCRGSTPSVSPIIPRPTATTRPPPKARRMQGAHRSSAARQLGMRRGSLRALMPRGHTWQMIAGPVLAASMLREVLTCHRRTGAGSFK